MINKISLEFGSMHFNTYNIASITSIFGNIKVVKPTTNVFDLTHSAFIYRAIITHTVHDKIAGKIAF